MIQRLWTFGIAGLALAGGCGAPPLDGAPAVRDSAGVQIVENRSPAWAEGGGWVLSVKPVLSLGGEPANAALDFANATAVRLSDDRIAVVNGETSEIRFFGPDGRYLATTGRRGGGPGEFQAIGEAYLGPGDSLLVPDMMQQRLSVLGPDGAFARSFSLGGAAGFTMDAGGSVSLAVPMGWLADGTVLAMSGTWRMNDPREGRYRDTTTLVVYAPDGAFRDTVARVPGLEMERVTMTFGTQSMGIPSAVPLGRQTIVHAHGDWIYVATNDAWELAQWTSTGQLTRLIRVASPPVAITEADIAAHRQQMEAQITGNPQMRMVPQQLRDQMLARITQADYPPTLPYIARLLTDEDGTLWVQEVTRPGDQRERFAVLDSTGRLLGRVTMPERFRPSHITREAVVGVWKDADDVEYIRVYAVVRG